MLDFLIRSLEQGFIYSILVLGVYITYCILDFPDLTVDGSFPLGAAVSAKLIISGVNPVLSLIGALLAGILAGLCTGLLHTKFKITNLLSGILVMIALYSVNLRVMGRANIPLLTEPTIFRQFNNFFQSHYANLILLLVLCIGVKIVLDLLFQTRIGLTLRATGDNQQLVNNLQTNPAIMILFGLGLSNGLAALAGGLVAQFQGFADVSMGIGTIITGLASVIIGRALLKPEKFILGTTAVLIGSIVYRGAIRTSLTLGLAPTDLKLITAILVILALCLPQTAIGKSLRLKKRGVRNA